jgi:short subunit dehydrogenase-like uncharacterized protein
MGEVWILGATGRTGRAVAARLADQGVPAVLVGRDAERLKKVAGAGQRIVVSASPAATATEIAREQPAVVVNTIGPFAETAGPIARACLPGGHYVDLANDLIAITGLESLDAEAVAAGRTLVTGAGFGVLATESVVAKLCEGRPTPSRVRVDAVASVEIEAGLVGEAFATTITDILAIGGRRYERGRLVRTRPGGDLQHLTLPDGETASTAGAPTGELHAAWTASGAAYVTATTAMAPTAAAVRAILPLASAMMAVRPLRRFATRRLAGVHLDGGPRPRRHSWGHAQIQWPDGSSREGWLRTGDAMDFTVGAVAEAAARLARGAGQPGAHTPAAAFGPDIALAAGGEFLLP